MTAKTLFGDMPAPVKSWGGLFDLYQEPDGRFRAEFGVETAPCSFFLYWRLNDVDGKLARSLLCLAAGLAEIEPPKIPKLKHGFPLGSNIFEVCAAAQRLESAARFNADALLLPLHQALADELRILADEEQPKARVIARTVLAWTPGVLAIVTTLFSTPNQQIYFAGISLVALLLLAGVVSIFVHPDRGLHDLLSGSRIVMS